MPASAAPSAAPAAAFPDAPIVGLSRSCDGAIVVAVDCPLCSRSHLHGGGRDLDLDAVRWIALGHHTAHCADPALRPAGYVVSDPDGVLSAGLVRVAASPRRAR